MTILALETSAARCQAALYDGNSLRVVEESDAQHSRVLLALIQTLLKQEDLALQALQAIAVANGPGSFTGLRIGIAIAQGLAYAARLPVVPVGTLAALAYAAEQNSRAARGGLPLRVLAPIDARKAQVYSAWFHCNEESVQMLGQQSLDDPQNIACYAIEGDEANTVQSFEQLIVGTGLRYKEALPGWAQQYCNEQTSELEPGAEAVAGLAARALQRGQGIPAAELQPLYLRNKVTD
ncbi:MAG: tRNA (adenosine(37)-N6)-threonylcarbamoyltransferase complex dimerization subunit type 1 TsaB [Pseudomonadales bacterium]|nr:MAG: tRNA (adenosine(37)-N6)-threonylcarbamoyltransferase complex dimerization subunit type 1 TsaB [Pseudomonadales bacterium]